LRYQVLSRAKGRCELCGISKDEKALDVDHIVPRSKGGADDISLICKPCVTPATVKNETLMTRTFDRWLEQYQERDERLYLLLRGQPKEQLMKMNWLLRLRTNIQSLKVTP
jgi:5-methylcytosine-specific restriction endonuclease McrA